MLCVMETGTIRTFIRMMRNGMTILGMTVGIGIRIRTKFGLLRIGLQDLALRQLWIMF